MTNVSLGEHSKLMANPGDRHRAEVLHTGARLPGNEGIRKNRYLSHLDRLLPGCRVRRFRSQRGGWFEVDLAELRAPQPEALKTRILEFGIEEVPFWDKEHFYFQAPGGQVFRLVGKTEDMSRWPR